MKKIIPREVVKCAHIHLFSFLSERELRMSFIGVSHIEKSVCPCSPGIFRNPHPLKETQTKPGLFLLRRTRREGAKKEDTLGQGLGQRRSPGPAPAAAGPVGLPAHSPEWGHTPKNKMSFMNHTHYWGQKPKKRGRGGRKINNPLTVWWQNSAKELISTSAKPLENTNTGFSHNPWVLRRWGGIKGTKK